MNPIRSRHARLPALLAAAGLLASGGCGAGSEDERAEPISRGGAVSAPTVEAADAGLEVLVAGGNATDAAVAVALALGVTQPSRAGLGATALLLVRTPDGEVRVVRGPDADGAPELVRVLDEARRRFGSGRLEWERLVEPARRIAEDGFLLDREEHRSRITQIDRLAEDSGAAALLLRPGGAVPTERSRVHSPAMARTLRRLARAGPEDFYEGQLATRMIEVADDDGEGRWEGTPSGVPAAVVEESAGSTYRGWQVFAVPRASAGDRILRALDLLGRAPAEVLDREGTARTLWIAEALAYAAGTEADPAGGEDPGEAEDDEADGADGGVGAVRDPAAWLESRPPLPTGPVSDTAPTSAGRTRAPPERIAPAPSRADARPGSTAFAVLDGSGGMVMGILSLGREFGTGRTAGDLGFFYRTPLPAGVREAGAAVLAIRGDSLPRLGAAAAGVGATDGLIQVLTGSIDGGLAVREAVDLPRVRALADTAGRAHVFLEGMEWSRGILEGMRRWSEFPDSLRRLPVEGGARAATAPEGLSYWGASVRPRMVERGWVLGEWPRHGPDERLDPRFGVVHAIAAHEGGWEVAADPRGDGGTRVLSAEEAATAEIRGRR